MYSISYTRPSSKVNSQRPVQTSLSKSVSFMFPLKVKSEEVNVPFPSPPSNSKLMFFQVFEFPV